MLKQSHVFLPFFYNFCQHSLIYLFLLGLVTCSQLLPLAFSLIGCPGIGPMACLDNNRQLSIIAMVHVSNWSKQWHCFEFLKLFFHSTVFFLCFLQETERPMHLSYRETNYKKRVEQVVCSIAVSFNIFSQPNFLTKQLKNFLSDKQILRF